MQECLHARTVPMKKAEIYMATFWAGLSIAIMMEIQVIPGTKQPIGWARGVGPQSGWFPFYLALIMLLCSLVVLIPKLVQAAREGLADKPFVSMDGLKAVLRAFGPMLAYVCTLPWVLPRVHALSRLCTPGLWESIPGRCRWRPESFSVRRSSQSLKSISCLRWPREFWNRF